MIDTDKYEGHTEGEWTVDIDSYDKYGSIRPVEISRHERGQKGWTLIATIRHRKPLHALEYEKANAQLIADAPLLLAEVKRLTEFRDKVLAAFIEMPRNSRSLTYLLNDEGYLKHYTLEDYRKGLHPYSLGLYELHEEWKEKAQQYLGEEEE